MSLMTLVGWMIACLSARFSLYSIFMRYWILHRMLQYFFGFYKLWWILKYINGYTNLFNVDGKMLNRITKDTNQIRKGEDNLTEMIRDAPKISAFQWQTEIEWYSLPSEDIYSRLSFAYSVFDFVCRLFFA